MNCQTCLKANKIPNCYTGSPTITVGYLDAAYQNTAVIVKIANTATGKLRTEEITTDGSGNVTFTAFDMMSHIYKVEVILPDTSEPLTIYSTVTNDSTETSGCCVEFEAYDYASTDNQTLNYKTC